MCGEIMLPIAIASKGAVNARATRTAASCRAARDSLFPWRSVRGPAPCHKSAVPRLGRSNLRMHRHVYSVLLARAQATQVRAPSRTGTRPRTNRRTPDTSTNIRPRSFAHGRLSSSMGLTTESRPAQPSQFAAPAGAPRAPVPKSSSSAAAEPPESSPDLPGTSPGIRPSKEIILCRCAAFVESGLGITSMPQTGSFCRMGNDRSLVCPTFEVLHFRQPDRAWRNRAVINTRH